MANGWRANFDDDKRVVEPVLRPPASDAHKYSRGSALCFSGPALSTGAIRLSAQAALTVGAGLVTIVGERAALEEHSAQVTAVMLRPEGKADPLDDDRTRAVLIGPGAGRGDTTRHRVRRILKRQVSTVLDADALTSFSDEPEQLFALLHEDCVLTPHEGEFQRLFPDIDLGDGAKAARLAAERAGCTVLLKGARTEIAGPERHGFNDHSTSWLATAGSGDVLAGIVTGLLAQGVDTFDAACIAAWMHGETGRRGGAGLTADRLDSHLVEAMNSIVRAEG